MAELEISLLSNFADIPAREWDALACPEGASGRPLDPFTTHRFLMALESSGSIGVRSGWQARPMILREAGKTIAAMPLFVKTNSQGEYIFDHNWANAFERAGGKYYPKLQVAVPFTPASGRRFLTLPGQEEIGAKGLIAGAIQTAEQNGLSSLHITFCTEDEARLGAEMGLMHRITQQFHWINQGYATFDDFLARLSSRKRKAIRKERDTANAAGLTIQTLTGDALLPAHWDAFWQFYQDTGARKWGTPYLTRAAFTEFHSHMRDDTLLVMAFAGDRPVAGALNFIGRDTLFGRYWGCVEDHPCLHFELCYYRAIDWAIAHGLKRVEAGAQGDHKLARGYLPTPIHSLHWIANDGFARAVADYLDAERNAMAEDIEVMTAYGPFRLSADSG
ncbi:GNAT family N-acetyltransferase [Pseudorhodobacter sp.]|uniref:GNAT family N-acetyltransferase n=1 Tax=Pseudorhodobacter sp. TaxID=1934400 RepID=UPI002647E7E1|nr:GNAT family N-acetyltransferase [Pseudorhodobacter sp.]MDN5786549.1 GNAT family N-acetyltransferase [Pseudorhodobacter sp.]